MNSNIEQKLKVLSDNYAKQLPIKISEVEKLWRKQKKVFEVDQFNDFKRAIHTLCGTSGTYGYKMISDAACKLEKLLNNTPSEQLLKSHEVDNILQDLKQLAIKPPERNIITQTKQLPHLTTKTKLIYLLANPADQYDIDQVEQIKQFNYDIKLFFSVTDLELALDDHPQMILIDIEFAKDITPEMCQRFREDLIFIMYMSRQDDLMTRLLALRHGGQAFIITPLEVSTLLHMMDNLFFLKNIQNDRILIVDDSKHVAEYYASILQSLGMLTQKVTDPQEFLSALVEFQPDLILMDINMPYSSGIELAQIVQQQENLSELPIIFLSSIAEKNKQLEVLSYAGDDFLTKPVSPKHLIATVHNRLMRARMLKSRMLRDSLTNLFNHTITHHFLEREISLAERYQQDLCVILLDIDHFKKINDTFGHQIGDVILKEFAVFLQHNLRKTDIIGRYGGEEFMIILPNTTITQAFILLEDLRVKYAATPHYFNNEKIFVTFSGGIATYPTIKKSNHLIKAADVALYQAKEEGRNRMCKAK